MSKTIIGAAFTLVDFFDTSSLTARWWGLAAGSDNAGSTTEAWAQWKINNAGTLADLTFNVLTNTNTSSATLNSRVGGANGNLTVSIAGSATGAMSDSTHSDSLSAGNAINMQFGALGFLKHVTFAGSLHCSFNGTSSVAAGWQCLSSYATGGQTTFNLGNASQTSFVNPTGLIGNMNNTTEALFAQVPIRSAGTFSRGSIYITTNTSTNSLSCTFRVTGANGNIALSIGASSTGFIEDTTHSDSVTTTDKVCWATTSGAGTVNAKVVCLGVNFASSGTNWDLRSGKSKGTATTSFTNGVTAYVCPIGGNDSLSGDPTGGWSTTETKVQTKAPFAFYGDHMIVIRASISGGQTTPTTMTARVNAANGLGSISLTSSTTGIYEDSTHVDSLSAGDLLAFAFLQTNGSNDQIQTVGIRGDTVNPAGAGGRSRRVTPILYC